MRIAIIAASAALLSVSAAHAGGLYDKGSLKDTPSYVETATPMWGGLYIGGSVGFGTGDTTDKADVDFGNYDGEKSERQSDFEALLEAILQSKYDVNGAIYGVHAGYNWQRGNLVYGLEAGFNGTNMDGASPCVVLLSCERELDWYGTGVARIGYAPGNTFFYGFGGIAWGEVNTKIGLISPGVPLYVEGSETHVGWTAGAGIEHAFNNRFSVRVEYSHVDLGEENTALSFEGYTLDGISDKVDLSFDAIKVGASYKLTGSDAPLK